MDAFHYYGMQEDIDIVADVDNVVWIDLTFEVEVVGSDVVDD